MELQDNEKASWCWGVDTLKVGHVICVAIFKEYGNTKIQLASSLSTNSVKAKVLIIEKLSRILMVTTNLGEMIIYKFDSIYYIVDINKETVEEFNLKLKRSIN